MKTVTEHQFENQTLGEEIANSITHGIGALLSIAATSILIVYAALKGSAVGVVSFSVYGTTLCLLYAASSLYHGVQSTSSKHLFHIFDHSAIFLLIAGTYTPLTLVGIGGAFGWTLFGVAWGLAIAGMAATVLLFEKARHFNVGLYIAMGWLIILAVPTMLDRFSSSALIWLLAGGLSYTGGVFFYRAKTLPYSHMVWHLFVIGGSVCHFFMMFSL